MNEVFDLKRFVLVLRNLAQGRLKYVLLLPFLIILIQALTFLNELYGWEGGIDTAKRYFRLDAENYFYPGYLIGLMLVATMFAVLFQRKNMEKAVFLQLPASVFEKWLAVVFYVLVPFTVLYLLLFLGFEKWELAQVNKYKQQYLGEFELVYNAVDVYKYRLIYFVGVVWAMAAFVLCATTYFKKAPLVFTLVLLVAIGFAGSYLNLGFAKMVVADGLVVKGAVPFLKVDLIDPMQPGVMIGPYHFASMVFNMQHYKPLFYFLAHPLLLCGLLGVYYYRIKESVA